MILDYGKVYLVQMMDAAPYENHSFIDSAHSSRDGAVRRIENDLNAVKQKGYDLWASRSDNGYKEYIYTIIEMVVRDDKE